MHLRMVTCPCILKGHNGSLPKTYWYCDDCCKHALWGLVATPRAMMELDMGAKD